MKDKATSNMTTIVRKFCENEMHLPAMDCEGKDSIHRHK